MLAVDFMSRSKFNKELTSAAMFYLDLLGITQITKATDVYIMFADIDANGYCDYNYDHKYPEVTILLNKDITSINELLLTLAHECVHAKQFLRNELQLRGKKKFWKKMLYDSNSSEAYNNSPWELEAYDQEDRLFRSYANSRGFKLL